MANKRLNATIQIGGAVAGSLRAAFSDIKGQVGQVGSALRRLENEQRLLTTSIRTFGEMGKNVDGLRARYAALTVQVDKLRGAHERLRKVEAAQKANLDKRAEYRGQMLDAVALGATAAAPIKKAVEFENAMLGVAKQVDGARDANGELTQIYYDMGKAIQQMGREIPMTTNALADMVTSGARMGVGKDMDPDEARKTLIEFTRVSAKMAEAFELPAGELADNMGKIAGMYKIPIPAISELADTINYLDDNAISKGGDIIEYMARVGGVAGSVKITDKQVAALGSTLLTLGERTEAAGTATNAMLQKFAAANFGSKKLREAFKMIGLSTKDVSRGMQTDAMGTLLNVLDRIGKLDAEKRLGVMVDLVGLEHSDTMAKLAVNTEELRKQLKLTNDEKAKGSMDREFQARLKTTGAQMKLTANRVGELAVNIGSVLLPAVNNVFGAINPVFSAMAEFARDNPKLTQAIVGTAVAFVGLRMSTLLAGYAFTFMKGGALQFVGMLAKMRAGAVLAAARMPVLLASIKALTLASMRFALTPIGAAITAIAIGGYLIYQNWDGVKALMIGVFDGITSGLQPLVDSFKAFWQALSPLHPTFEKIGEAVKVAWNWFNQLLGPVQYSEEALGKAGRAGEAYGKFLAAGINFVLMPLKTLIDGLTWVANNIGGIADKAIAFKNAVGNGVGGAWQSTKDFLGVGDQSVTEPSPISRAQGMGLPSPMMATARGQGGTYTDASQNTYQIVQQPGENNRDLARRIAEEQERQRGIRQRSTMTDGVTAQ